jgi:uroporphyrinogen decarboxylase
VVDATPVWLLGQADIDWPEARKLREGRSPLELYTNPELAARATLLPPKRFGFDAAVLRADPYGPLRALGIELLYPESGGREEAEPTLPHPLATTRDIDLLPCPAAEEALPEVCAALRLLAPELAALGLPLVGFALAPLSLAARALEGGPASSFARVKLLMLRESAAWERLMKKLTAFQADNLAAQARAGVQVLELFDGTAGFLGRADYLRYVAPFDRQLVASARKTGLPLIHYSTGTGAFLEDIAAAGAEALGLDGALTLGEARRRLGWERPVQGNLEALTLFAPWRELKFRIDAIMEGNEGRPGLLFNLDRPLLPGTPADLVERLVDYVHEGAKGGGA